MKTVQRTAIIAFTLALMFWGTVAHAADSIKGFVIDGNQRIEKETIVSYSGMRLGDPFDQDLLNTALKNLYATGLFSDISLYQENDNLVIRVAEKPIINEIRFEGNDEVKTDALMLEIQLRPRQVLTRTKVQEDVDRLKEVYRLSGHFAVVIDPKIIKLEQNRVNLVFEITEGEETLISSIRFIGNKYYDAGTLEKVIISQEKRWYRFWASDDKYDPDRLEYDSELLRRFYLEHGYVDFKVEAAVAELSPDQKDFFVTFSLNEGNRYKVGSIDVSTSIPDLNVDALRKSISFKKGEWYSSKEIEKTITRMTEKLGNMQFAFVDVRPGVHRDKENNLVNIEFVVNEGKKTFIDNIKISGNTRTLDEVVRREFTLIEGDPYNQDKIKKSEQNVKNLNFFETVEVKPVPGADPNKTDIEVAVEEKSTGSMSIGFGFSSTEGALSDFHIAERNFLGRGQRLGLSATLAAERTEFDVNFAEPYFLNRDLLAGINVFHITQDFQDESSFDRKITGGELKLGYPLAENLRQTIAYRYDETDITNVQATASSFIQEQAGLSVTSYISQVLAYDTRDSRMNATEGAIAILDTRLAGVGGNKRYSRMKLTGKYYYPIIDKWVISMLGETGMIAGWGGKDVRVDDRFFLGGDDLRGFADYGIGPRDSATNDSLGGNHYWRGSFEVAFPSGLPEELGVRGHVFSDFGALWYLDDNDATILDSSNPRFSAGGGVSWRSPFGLIKLNWAETLKKEEFDETEEFRISFDTRL